MMIVAQLALVLLDVFQKLDLAHASAAYICCQKVDMRALGKLLPPEEDT